MIYFEMSRDEDHGGGTWGFTNCVWAPTKKENGALWPFWSKVSHIREGDIVIHLKGKAPNAYFLGYSVAASDGFKTTKRPPNPGIWAFAEAFYRADLTGFIEFYQPINLTELLASRRTEVEEYFNVNRSKTKTKANIFVVKQAGRLQCLNGAYLSDVDVDLLAALFGRGSTVFAPQSKRPIVSVETGFQISMVRTRLGQASFSSAIKTIYGNRCCFPGCQVADPRFLIGAHIARWSDNERLRGDTSNGLCLCLIHDKAFEIGLFTIDEHYRVFVNPKERSRESYISNELLQWHGQQIRLSEVKPSQDAILEHWIRVDIEP